MNSKKIRLLFTGKAYKMAVVGKCGKRKIANTQLTVKEK